METRWVHKHNGRTISVIPFGNQFKTITYIPVGDHKTVSVTENLFNCIKNLNKLLISRGYDIYQIIYG